MTLIQILDMYVWIEAIYAEGVLKYSKIFKCIRKFEIHFSVLNCRTILSFNEFDRVQQYFTDSTGFDRIQQNLKQFDRFNRIWQNPVGFEQDLTESDMIRQDRTWQDRTGKDRTGRNRKGQEDDLEEIENKL